MRADRAEAEPPGQPVPVHRQPGTARPARPPGRGVRPAVGGFDPVQVADRLLGETTEVMPERGRLRRLQVRGVGPERGGVPGFLVRGGGSERGDIGVQAE